MGKYFKIYIIYFLLIQNISATALKSNSSNGNSNQETLDIVSNGAQGILNESKTALITEDPLQTQNYNSLDEDIDFSTFQDISLKRVILQTISSSNTLKAANEKLIQARISYKESRTGYLPTVDFQLDTKVEKTYKVLDNAKGVRETQTANDQRYKFVVNQPIYSGGTTALKIKSVEAKFKEAKFKYEIVLNQTIQEAISSYFKLLFDIEKVKINQKNMEKLNKILEISQVKYDSGAINVGDLAATKASVANAQTQLNRVKSKLADSIDYYLYLLGDDFKKTKPYEKNFSVELGTYEELKDEIISKNLNLINYRLNILGTKYKLKSFKYNLKPKVDLQMNMSHILNQQDYVDDEESYSAKLVLRYNIFNKGLDVNKISKVYSSVEELKFRYAQEIKKISWDTSKLYNSIKSLKESLKSTKEEIKSSTEMVDVYWEGFQLGEQELPVLLQGQRQLNTAQINLLKLKQDYLTNIFKVLNQTNELSAFFDIDPYSTNFIDYKNVKTVQNVIKMDKSIKDAVLDLNDTIKSYLEITHDYSYDDTLNFKDKLLDANDSKYTILIEYFNNNYEAYKYIKLNNLFTEAFVFDKINNKEELDKITLNKNIKIKTNIAKGIYENISDANSDIENITNEEDKTFTVVSLKNIKDLYSNYVNGIQASIKPYIIKEIKPKKFKTNKEFKELFLNANEDQYTINIVSLTTMKQAQKLLSNFDITNNSFVFKYGLNGEWIKVMYGVFDTYSQALDAINQKPILRDKYYPIIEKVSQKQKLYKKYENFNIEKVVKKELKKPTLIEIKNEANKLIPKKVIPAVKPILNISKDLNSSINKDIKKNEPIIYNERFANKLLSSDGYTIKMGYVTKDRILGFANDYLKDDHFAKVKVGNLYKILYGSYSTEEEAKEAILTLHPKRIKKASVVKLPLNSNTKTKEVNTTISIDNNISIDTNNSSEQKGEIDLTDIQTNSTNLELSFEDKFYQQKESYTILLGIVKHKNLKEFISRYLLDDKYIIIKVNTNYHIYYNIFNSLDEAKKNLINLHPSLIKKATIHQIKSVL